MSNSLYYGEIAAKISAHLYQNPDQIMEIDLILSQEDDKNDQTLWTICADAARVFDTIENLSEEHFIDWHEALDNYADGLLDHLLQGETPNIIDMVSMASESIQNTL